MTCSSSSAATILGEVNNPVSSFSGSSTFPSLSVSSSSSISHSFSTSSSSRPSSVCCPTSVSPTKALSTHTIWPVVGSYESQHLSGAFASGSSASSPAKSVLYGTSCSSEHNAASFDIKDIFNSDPASTLSSSNSAALIGHTSVSSLSSSSPPSVVTSSYLSPSSAVFIPQSASATSPGLLSTLSTPCESSSSSLFMPSSSSTSYCASVSSIQPPSPHTGSTTHITASNTTSSTEMASSLPELPSIFQLPSSASSSSATTALSPLSVSAQSILQWGGIRTHSSLSDTQTQVQHTHEGVHSLERARHVSSARPGEHLICIYDTEGEIGSVLSSFIMTAIMNHEQVLVISDTWTKDYIGRLLAVFNLAKIGKNPGVVSRESRAEKKRTVIEERGQDQETKQKCKPKEQRGVEEESEVGAMKKAEVFSEGQLVMAQYDRTVFMAKAVREQNMLRLVQSATQQGFSGVRIVGDTSWMHTHQAVLTGPDWLEYEATCNEIFESHFPIGSLCLYDTRVWPPNHLLALLQTHPFVILPSTQAIVKNMYYIPPMAFSASPAEFDRHVLDTMSQHLHESHANMEEAYARTQSLAQTVERAQSVARQQQSIASNDLRRPLDNILSLASTLTMLDPHSPPNEEMRQNMKRFRENVTGLLEVIRDILDLFRMNSGQVHVRVAPYSVRAMLSGLWSTARELIDEKQKQMTLPSGGRVTSSSCSSLSSASSLSSLPSSTANTLSPSLGPCALSSFLVSSSAASMPPVVTRYKPEGGLIELRLSVDPRIASYLQGDSPKMTQIITNLLSNAVKYTDRGVIEIAARISDDMKLLEMYVRDTGPGIPESVRPRIFQMLMQEDYSDQSDTHAQPQPADHSPSSARMGTGLGLHVAKRLAEMIGGDLRCESAVGIGATFALSVPYIPSGQYGPWWDISGGKPQETTGSKHTSSGMRIEAQREPVEESVRSTHEEQDRRQVCVLVVEDDAASRRLVTHILARAGYRVIGAETGRQAIDALESKRNFVDIILLDMHLPDMNGLDIAIAIRQMEKTRQVGRLIQTEASNEPISTTAGTQSQSFKQADTAELRRQSKKVVQGGTHMDEESAGAPSTLSFSVPTCSSSCSTPHSSAQDHRRSSTSSTTFSLSCGSFVPSPSHPPSLPFSAASSSSLCTYNATAETRHTDLPPLSLPNPDIPVSSPANQRAPRRIPIVFLSGQDYESLMDALHASGADDILRKPVSRQELLDMVGKWASRGKRSKTG